MSTEETKQDALDQADLQMASIHRFVNALNLDWDRLEELRDEDTELRQLCAQAGASRSAHDALAEFETENGDELRELEAAAGEWNSLEEVERAIREDALSIEVRSDWTTPGDPLEPEDFRIVLCTGGPHVQIAGELSQGEPSRAWLEYSGWFIPMTDRMNKPGDMAALLAYARQFYFGE